MKKERREAWTLFMKAMLMFPGKQYDDSGYELTPTPKNQAVFADAALVEWDKRFNPEKK